MDDGAGTALRSGLVGVRRSRARRRRPILDVHDVKQPGSIGAVFSGAHAQQRAPVTSSYARLVARRDEAAQLPASSERKGDVKRCTRARNRRRVGAFVTVCRRSPDLVGHLAPPAGFGGRVWPWPPLRLVTSALVRASVCTRWNRHTALPRAHADGRPVAIATARRRYWRRDMTVSKSSVPRFAHTRRRELGAVCGRLSRQNQGVVKGVCPLRAQKSKPMCSERTAARLLPIFDQQVGCLGQARDAARWRNP